MLAIIATDGSGPSSYNSGLVAGYAAVVISHDNIKTTYSGSVECKDILDASISNGKMNIIYGDKKVQATNNRGELCGLLCGILHAKLMGYTDVLMLLDSKYCINTMEPGGYMETWIRNNTILNKENPDLTMLVYGHMQGINITFQHQYSHLTNAQKSKLNASELFKVKLNEEADQLARKAKFN